MTLKKRLKISNFLMIIIPILVLCVVSGVCLISGFIVIKNKGFEVKDSDFYRSRIYIANEINENLDEDLSLDGLINLFDEKQIRIIVTKNDDLIYQYGEECVDDLKLSDIALENSYIALDNRAIYSYKHNEYNVKLFCSVLDLSYSSLKKIILIVAFIIALALLLSVILTDYFLRCFVIKKIEEPLDKLYNASKLASLSDLDYEIEYDNDDEFKPIIDEFNNKNKELKKSVLKIEESNKEKQMLLQGIAHDIKSPLTSIIGCVEGINDGVAESLGKTNEYLNIIKNKCLDINKMVSRLTTITVSKCSNFKINVLKSIVDFINDNESSYLGLGIKIDFINNYNDDFYINCGNDDFKRCLSNICDNSYKYNTNKNVHIIISCLRINNEFVLKIADDGCGVDDGDISYIFNPFFRSDKARSNPNNSNGLGLAIVKKIIENSDGVIKAYNNNGLCIEMKWRCDDV